MDIFQDIHHALREGKTVALATIVTSRGSTPRTAGATLLVGQDGAIAGTIGGGRIEGEVIRSALNLIGTQGAILSSYHLTQAADMDMVCGGEMQVLTEHLPPSAENLEMLDAISEEIKRGRTFFWLGRMTADGEQWKIERAVRTSEGKWLGPLRAEPGLHEMLAANSRQNLTALVECGAQRYVVAAISAPKTLYLMGAGHVSREIAVLAKRVAFRTLVFDDRAEFANPGNFPSADGVHVCANFADVFEEFAIPAGGYIVIVTRGHRCDKDVLAQALRSEAEYIGMIGSRRKRESVYQALMEEGFESGDLEQVHCPIGVAIAAETPAEIAVSVVAELIQHRAGRMPHE